MARLRPDVRSARVDTLWIVNHYADAPDRPNGTRHFDLARRLVRRGHRVVIFAAGLSHVTGREERLPRGMLYRREIVEGVEFVWLRTFRYRGNTWRRKVNMLSFAASFLLVQARFGAPSAILGSTVHPFAALAAWVAAAARRSRFVFEIRDLWPQTLIDLGEMRDGSPGERLLRTIEAFLVRRAEIVITLLPGVRDYLTERRLPTARVLYLPNGVDLETFDAAPAEGGELSGHVALSAATRLREEGRFVIGYVGSFGRVNQVATIIRAVVEAERRLPGRIGLLLVGDGPERSALERLSACGGEIVFAPAIAKRLVPIVLRSLDAAVVHATTTAVYRFGISFNKLFEYMAAARPVLFACATAYDPVVEAGAGVVIPPDDADALASAMLEIADTALATLTAMGTAGRDFVEKHHDIALLSQRLEQAIWPGSIAPGEDTAGGSFAIGASH
ncbi:MAG: glycosyltransferase family 4 protein [Candidatus Limnocylindrales bacterium]